MSKELQQLAGQCRMAIRHTENLSVGIQELAQQNRPTGHTQSSSVLSSLGGTSPRGSSSVGRGTYASSQRLSPRSQGKEVGSDANVQCVSPRKASLSPWARRLSQANPAEAPLELRSPRLKVNQESNTGQRISTLHRMMMKRSEDNRGLCKEARTLGTRVMRFLAATSLDAKVSSGGSRDRSMSPLAIRQPLQLQRLRDMNVDDLQLHLQQANGTESPSHCHGQHQHQEQTLSHAGSSPVLAASYTVVDVSEPAPASPISPRIRVGNYKQRSVSSPHSAKSPRGSPLEGSSSLGARSPRGSPLEECRLDSPDGSPDRAGMRRRGLVTNAWCLQHTAA